MEDKAIANAIIDNSFPLITRRNCIDNIKSGNVLETAKLISLFGKGVKLASSQKLRIHQDVQVRAVKLTDNMIETTIPSGNKNILYSIITI